MVLSNLDFTLSKYQDLCQNALGSGYRIQDIRSYLQHPDSPSPVLIMRHDVDRYLSKSLHMAILEMSLGITSTYYFRRSGFSQPGIIKSIASMGHEIGFHYEVLDEAKGDYELSLKIFNRELTQLRQLAKVDTICMHGNPLTRWLNRDVWRHYDFRDFGLIGEAYLSLKNIYYFSDTGRIWDMSRKVKDNLPYALPLLDNISGKITSTDDVIGMIKRRILPRICITTHPERWSYNLTTWIFDQVRDTGMNAAKTAFRMLNTVRRGYAGVVPVEK